uniref:Uncharacterized protein n=1 Tax=Manihot esculenta TaxID=3983 RepID=A0A2C9UUS7_MANES
MLKIPFPHHFVYFPEMVKSFSFLFFPDLFSSLKLQRFQQLASPIAKWSIELVNEMTTVQ